MVACHRAICGNSGFSIIKLSFGHCFICSNLATSTSEPIAPLFGCDNLASLPSLKTITVMPNIFWCSTIMCVSESLVDASGLLLICGKQCFRYLHQRWPVECFDHSLKANIGWNHTEAEGSANKTPLFSDNHEWSKMEVSERSTLMWKAPNHGNR